MKRYFTLIAGIINFVLCSVLFVNTFYTIRQCLRVYGNEFFLHTEATLIFLEAVLFLIALILNVCTASNWKRDLEIYNRRKGLIIATIVFSFVAGIFELFVGIGYFLRVVFVVVIFVSTILLIVDLAKESRLNK